MNCGEEEDPTFLTSMPLDVSVISLILVTSLKSLILRLTLVENRVFNDGSNGALTMVLQTVVVSAVVKGGSLTTVVNHRL